MEDDLKLYLQDFFKICYSRIEKGGEIHDRDFEKIDLYQEIMEELADVSNYAFLEYVKIRRLKERKAGLIKQSEDVEPAK